MPCDRLGENQSELRNVYVYDHTKKQGNMKVIVSETGKMEMTDDEMFLNIELFEGNSYEDIYPNKVEDRDNYPFVNSSFSRTLIRFNLSEFQSGDLRSGSRKDFDMLNIIQLESTTDSLRGVLKDRRRDFEQSMLEKYSFAELTQRDSLEAAGTLKNRPDQNIDPAILDDDLLSNIDPIDKSRVIQNALRIARSNKAYYDNTETEYLWRNKLIARHLLEWHKKFSISFSCIVLFFIGAPLGGIIRKGGMGMPVVVSVIIFLIYHVTSYSFEKMGRELVWTPFRAIWSANLMLFPIGIWLTYKSATDSAIFNIEMYLRPFQKISGIFASRKKRG